MARRLPEGRKEINAPRNVHGKVRGKTIELEEDLGIPEGEEVDVTVTSKKREQPWGEGIRRSAGAAVNMPELVKSSSNLKENAKLPRSGSPASELLARHKHLLGSYAKAVWLGPSFHSAFGSTAGSGRRRRGTRKERVGDDLPSVRRDTDGVAGRVPRTVSPLHVRAAASGTGHATFQASEAAACYLPRATGGLMRSMISSMMTLTLFRKRSQRAMIATSLKSCFRVCKASHCAQTCPCRPLAFSISHDAGDSLRQIAPSRLVHRRQFHGPPSKTR